MTTAPDWIRARAVKAGSLAELAKVAIAELERIGNDVGMVCGPVSTGGLGDIEKNLGVFNASIATLRRSDPMLFDTLPYEAGIIDDRNAWEADPANAGKPFPLVLMAEFYQPLIAHRALTHAYFIPDWQRSFGATLQRGMLIGLKRRIIDLPPDWSRTFQLR